MKKLLSLMVCIALLLCALPVFAEEISVTGKVTEVEKYGHVLLDVTIEDFTGLGFELGDVVTVKAGTFEGDMPQFGHFGGGLAAHGGIVKLPDKGAERELPVREHYAGGLPGAQHIAYEYRKSPPLSSGHQVFSGRRTRVVLPDIIRSTGMAQVISEVIIGNMCSIGAMVTDSVSSTRKKPNEILAVQIVSQVFYSAGSIILKGYSSTAQSLVAILRNLAAMKGMMLAIAWANTSLASLPVFSATFSNAP